MGSGIAWIAACALIVAVANFLDEYHIRNDLKSRVRDGLKEVFRFLDRPQIANVPSALYSHIGARLKGLGWPDSIIAAIVAYFAIVGTFYVGRLFVGDPPLSNYFKYAANWFDSIYWAVVMFWGLCTGAVSFITVGAFLDRWNNTESLLHHWVISALSLIVLAMMALGTACGFLLLGWLNPALSLPGQVRGAGALLVGNPVFLLVLSIVCLWHAIALGLAMLLTTTFRSMYLAVHKGILSILNAASDPMKSPLKYFAALIAISALAFKFVSEVSK